MEYTAQGTIQVVLTSQDEEFVMLIPSPDYRLKCRGTEYAILLQSADLKKGPLKALAFPVDQRYKVEGARIGRLLQQAALHDTLVELRLDDDYAVIGAVVPAIPNKI